MLKEMLKSKIIATLILIIILFTKFAQAESNLTPTTTSSSTKIASLTSSSPTKIASLTSSSPTEAQPEIRDLPCFKSPPKIPGRAASQLTRDDERDISSKIAKVLKRNEQIVKHLNIAIKVEDLKTGKQVYSHNPYSAMVPASVTKSFTALAALEFLKPEFTYSTQILFDPSKINAQNELTDELYMKFTGDPSLTIDDLKQLLSKLNEYKVKTIAKNIIIDDFVFDQMYQAPGWAWDDNKFCFAAPTSAIVINKNCFQMNLIPNKTLNNLTHLTPISKVYADITNELITKKDNACAPELIAYFENKYSFEGCLNADSPEIPLRIAYQNPRLMIQSLIKELLQEQNIQFTGNILFSSTSPNLKIIFEHKSQPLADLIYKMMKNSDNVSVDNILKTLGAYYYNTQGTFNNGTKALVEILSKKTSIDFAHIKLFDGSGGSRYNLISPDQLVDLYKAAYNNSDFYNSLPISGIDGSLEVINNKELTGKIHAKTGSMGGVSALSGYIENNKKQTLVFAIMINGLGTRSELKNLIEQILEALYQ